MDKNEPSKSVFISYCWRDGNSYADELEDQSRDYFEVKRDKSQLKANDDIDALWEKLLSVIML